MKVTHRILIQAMEMILAGIFFASILPFSNESNAEGSIRER